MQFVHVGSSFRVTRITGPKHNLLGIEFWEGEAAPEPPIVETLGPEKQCRDSLPSDEVCKNVLLGVSDANQKYGTSFAVKRIQFVPIDSPPPLTYRALAHAIVERRAKQLPFAQS